MSSLSALNTTSHHVRRALIVVDMSVEQVAGIQYNLKALIANCQKLCMNSSQFFELILDSRLWLRSKDESSLAWVWPETYVSMFVADSEGASLVSDLRSYTNNMQFVEKNNYSCFANSILLSILQEAQVTEVYICGINTDYCVFATCLDSFQYKFRNFVIQDAVSSIGGKEAHEFGLKNLINHFGSQVLVQTKNCCGI
jgi:nicotinamidase-related amidase